MDLLSRTVNVKNRSNGSAGYVLPDTGVRRTWTPGEIKKNISVSELEQATFVPGGKVILEDYLLINDKEVCDFLGIKTEPEYFYTEKEVEILLSSKGSIEQFLDCLDFAPDGVIDMVKDMAVRLNISDIRKREAILEKTGFNVTNALANDSYSKEALDNSTTKESGRRSAPIGQEEPKSTQETGGRRSAPVDEAVKVPSYRRV